MRLLIKFTDYAEDFQNGTLYMNTLNYFWENGFEDQRDILEGVSAKSSKDFSNINIPSIKDYILSDYMFRAEGYKYCNVFCMYSLNIECYECFVKFNTNPDMIKFGKYAIIINDENEYYRRINAAAKKYSYLCGNVNYHRIPPSISSRNHILLNSKQLFDSKIINIQHRRDSFDKDEKYKYQSEWRLTLFRGIKSTEPFLLEIGDIRDISTCIKSEDFESEISNHIKNTKFDESNECYYGNIRRQHLREQFVKLGDDKCRLFLIFG